MESKTGKAATTAKNKYRSKAYDRAEIILPKGRKSELQAHAECRGESLNSFINRAIEKQVQRDKESAEE